MSIYGNKKPQLKWNYIFLAASPFSRVHSELAFDIYRVLVNLFFNFEDRYQVTLSHNFREMSHQEPSNAFQLDKGDYKLIRAPKKIILKREVE